MSIMALILTSTAFAEAATIPVGHTCDGPDLSPPLQWSKAPAGTKSFAVICDDPDAPAGTWVHWVLFNLPAGSLSLPGGVPALAEPTSGGRQGKNDFGRLGYGGPCPPRGPAHRYFFKVYALDADLSLPAGATKKQVEEAMKGHILAQGQLMGKHGR